MSIPIHGELLLLLLLLLLNVIVSLLLFIIDEGTGDVGDRFVLLKPTLSEAVFRLLLWNEYVPDLLFCCWDCFRTTLTDLSAFYKFDVEGANHWKIDFRRPLSHIRPVYIWCFRWLCIVFRQHSHTLVLSINWILNVRIHEKSSFVHPSHTLCLSTYDVLHGFGLFSNNTHTLWCFYELNVEGDNPWKIDFRRLLSHILCVYTWCSECRISDFLHLIVCQNLSISKSNSFRKL